MPHTHCFQGPWVFDNCPWLPASLVTASPVAKFVLRSGDLPSQKTHIVPENRPKPTRKFPLLPTHQFSEVNSLLVSGRVQKTKSASKHHKKLRPEGKIPRSEAISHGGCVSFHCLKASLKGTDSKSCHHKRSPFSYNPRATA